jgi:hypothetical protein
MTLQPRKPGRPGEPTGPDQPDQPDAARLLPWSRADGGPCYVVGDGTGRVSRLADSVEAIQLGMADDLLDHAADILADRQVTSRQLHFLAACLAEALRDVHRIAESRGARLGQPSVPSDDRHRDGKEPRQPQTGTEPHQPRNGMEPHQPGNGMEPRQPQK